MGRRIIVAIVAAAAALAVAAAVPAIAGAGTGGTSSPDRSGKRISGTGVQPGAPGVSSGVVVGSSWSGSATGGASTGIGYVAPDVPIAAPSGVLSVEPGVPCPARFPGPCGGGFPGAIGANTVTVTGSAVVSSQPDEAVIGLGVQTQASDAADALRENADRMAAVIKALTDLGIDRSDISTALVSLYPTYDSNGIAVTGYQAQNQITVTLHDLSKAGETIDTATAAGANLTTGITFQLSQGSPALTGALKAAVEDARSKADALAAAAGAKVGDVVAITEDSGGYPIPYAEAGVDSRAAGAPTPVVPPAIQTMVSVTVVWELQQAS